MPICPKCGIEVKPGYKFCTKCGQSMAQVVQPTKESPQPDANDEKGLREIAYGLTHPGVVLSQGTRGIQQDIRREDEVHAREEAQRLGYEMVKPPKPEEGQLPERQPYDATDQRPAVISDSIDSIDIVRGKAIWNIQPGQIARRITEAEFAEIEHLQGVIIQEGCTAIVYVDGEQIGLLSGGAYTFPQKSKEQKEEDRKKAEREVDQETDEKKKVRKRSLMERGLFSIVGDGLGLVRQFFFGEKEGESEQRREQRQQRVEQRLRHKNQPKLIRVYLVCDRSITLTFGGNINEGEYSFTPFKVTTKLVDVEMAVSLQLQIQDIHQFAVNYLADKDSASSLQFQKMLTPVVETTVRQLLRNLDYQQDGLPEPVVENLKKRIQSTINERLFGIQVIRVLDISDRSADFERFRSVERELFCSEKELEYLQHTGEFRNRLTVETNRQAVQAAQTSEELRRALQNINKDKLLSEDEMNQFVMLLESQKRIREATTEEQEHEALQGLRRSRLIEDDDIAALENTLAQGKLSRENITDIMRVQAAQKVRMTQQIADYEFSDNEADHMMARELRQAQHNGALTAAAISILRQKADAQFEIDQRQRDADFAARQREIAMQEQQARFEHERNRQDKFDDVDILARKAEIARQNMQAMKDAELAEQQARLQHEQQMRGMDAQVQMNRDNQFANMTAEQIRAAQLSHLDAAAQAEMARSYSSDKENEILRQVGADKEALLKQMLEMQNSNSAAQVAAMMQMASMMKDGMSQVSGNAAGFQQQRVEDMCAMKDEYRENMIHQQGRLDDNQKQALDFTTRPQQMIPPQPQAYPIQSGYQAPVTDSQSQSVKTAGRTCPSCGAALPEGETFCPECGTRIV